MSNVCGIWTSVWPSILGAIAFLHFVCSSMMTGLPAPALGGSIPYLIFYNVVRGIALGVGNAKPVSAP